MPDCGIHRPLSVLAGLADGLAPKERRYALGAISPNNVGPPLPFPTGGVERIGIQLYGAAILPTLPADRDPQVFAKCGVMSGEAVRCCPGAARELLVTGHFGHECSHVRGVLALDDGRVDHVAAVLADDVAQQRDLSRGDVDLAGAHVGGACP